MTDQAQTILSATADTILEKPIRIEVDVLHPRWWEKIGMKVGMMPRKRSFDIRPATLGNMIRISKLLLPVDVDIYRKSPILDASYQLISEHARTLAHVLAIAVINTEKEPPASLIKFFLNNLTSKEVKQLAGIVIQQLDVGNFMTTIVSIRGRNILETSRDTQRD